MRYRGISTGDRLKGAFRDRSLLTECRLVDVIRVIYGDTIDTRAGRVHFYVIGTPEREEAHFSEATKVTESLAGSKFR
ncbi:MAG: hypothetical protein OTJ98_05040 [Dehalococcoidia bacterium]|nr:hypothetical protein [Dehalococcoidia bacterium]